MAEPCTDHKVAFPCRSLQSTCRPHWGGVTGKTPIMNSCGSPMPFHASFRFLPLTSIRMHESSKTKTHRPTSELEQVTACATDGMVKHAVRL
jgi:hypothetical protein